MPLNGLQRDTLFSTITMCVDTILESSIDRAKKIEWLALCASKATPSIEEAVQVLKKYPALIKGLSEAVNVPAAARGYWRRLLICMEYDQPVPLDLLKELSQFNNYNPLLMAEMRLFENKIYAIPELSVIKNELLCLREAYLEMTPLASCSYGAPYRTYFFRIGQVPFNLDNFGPLPLKGEIEEDIKRLIEDRLEQADKYQKQIDDKEKSRKEMEEMVIVARKEAEKARLATTLLLDERAEQQKQELFKQEVFGNYRTFEKSASSLKPVTISDVLFSHQSFSNASQNESSTKKDRIFQMQHVLLNNRLTDMMRQATANMSKIDMTLKQSKNFLELRVAECCKVLLEVQWTLVDECFKELSFNADAINERYKTQLQAIYDMYLNDMVTKWMLDRKRWLSDSHLSITHKY